MSSVCAGVCLTLGELGKGKTVVHEAYERSDVSTERDSTAGATGERGEGRKNGLQRTGLGKGGE